MHRRLITLGSLLCLILLWVPPVQASNAPFSTAMSAAAQIRHVPLPVLQAIAYVNTRWEVINQPARDGGYLPMDITLSQVNLAAVLSGRSAVEVKTDPTANLDAGAALLAHLHSGGTDLASWRAAVTSLLGPYVSVEVFDDLRTGESRTTSTGEVITLAPQSLPAATPAQSRAGATAATAASSDYPPANWVSASPSNYSTANRPHDYPVDMIIIHDTEGSYGSAIQEFQNGATQASAHYVVGDAPNQLTQMVAERDIAWHAGNWDYNTRAIGIEHEGFAYGANWYTTAMYDTSAKLIASICSRWGVPMDRNHVIGHYQVPDPNNPGQFGGAGHHTDPGPHWDWNYYIGLAQRYASALPSPPRLGPDPTAIAGDAKATVSWKAAHTCYAPITGYTVVAQPGSITQQVPAAATSATVTGLQNGTAYTFTVTAHTAQGQDSLTTPAVTPNPLPFSGLYTIDAYGGTHANESAQLSSTAYWPGWQIARTGKTLPVTTGSPQTGFVLDGWGGLHQFGGAIAETSGSTGHYWKGWDIARDFAFLPDGSGGFVLDGWGGLHPFRLNGSTAPLQAQGFTYWGWDIARKVVIFADGSGGYVLDGWGGLHPFGINGPVPPTAATIAGGSYWPGWDIARDIVLTPGNLNHSGYLLDGYGGIHPFHSATDGSTMPTGIHSAYFGWDIARRLWLSRGSTATAPTGYMLNGWGGLSAFGPVGTPLAPVWNGWDIAVGLTGQ
jgi:N-acetyl-anhydromuramyl-L-alanine amidase AmpD